jgi:hypothetical protein
MRKRLKKGSTTFLSENIIFIVLNLAFLIILILFLFTKTGSAAVLEEKYAKQIALILDSAKPVMEISLNMEDALKISKKEKFKGKIVSIGDNIVTVKLRNEGNGYSYSFFNDVEVNSYPIDDKNYIFIISGYK